MEDNVTASERTAQRKARSGEVVSDCQDKTIVVRVERLVPHPLYGKVIRQWKKYYVHDENNEARTGDEVEIMETRPLSKTKRWRLTSIVKRAVTE
ncbi:MAG: 30S ribosomal protein S17 [Lentisphaeria bacterium]